MTVYLDYNATSPLCDAARDAVYAVVDGDAGNPSSLHLPGQRARRHLDAARRRVATALGGSPGEVTFTSGASEANHLGLRGHAHYLQRAGSVRDDGAPPVALISALEHPSMVAASDCLSALGWRVVELSVGSDGRIRPETVTAALERDQVSLIALLAVNNELGVCQPIAQIAALTRARGVTLLCDATQALGRITVNVKAWGVDLLTLSGHKIGGLAGSGALWVRAGVGCDPLFAGHQEQGLRAGTENVAGAVALGAACTALEGRLADGDRIRDLRDRLWQGIGALLPNALRNGSEEAAHETGQTLNVSFAGVEAATLVMALDLEGIAVSAGAACSSGTLEPARAVLAIGDGSAAWLGRARSAVRFSFGPGNSDADVERVLAVLPALVERCHAR